MLVLELTVAPALPDWCPTGGATDTAPGVGAGPGPAPAGGQALTPLPSEGCPGEMLLLGEACPPAFHFVSKWAVTGL